MTQSVGAAKAVAQQLDTQGQHDAATVVNQVADSAFIHGLSIGCMVAGAVAVAGAVMAALFLPAQPPGVEALTEREPSAYAVTEGA
jgi:hypothetical protein